MRGRRRLTVYGLRGLRRAIPHRGVVLLAGLGLVVGAACSTGTPASERAVSPDVSPAAASAEAGGPAATFGTSGAPISPDRVAAPVTPTIGPAPAPPANVARVEHAAAPGRTSSGNGTSGAPAPSLDCPRRVLFRGLPVATFECTITNVGAAGTVAWRVTPETGGAEIAPRMGTVDDLSAGETRRLRFVALRGPLPSTHRFVAVDPETGADIGTGGVQVLEDGADTVCTGCITDGTNDFFHPNQSVAPFSRGLDIFQAHSVIADASELRRVLGRDGPLACGAEGFAGPHSTVVCEAGAGELAAGPAVVVWMHGGQRFGPDVHSYPFATGAFNVEMVAGFDVDGDLQNNFGAALAGLFDLHQGLDKWYEVSFNVRRPGWRLFRVDMVNNRLTPTPTTARFVIAADSVLFVIPLSEFGGAQVDRMGYRLATFSYESEDRSEDLVTGAADVSSDFGVPLPLVAG